MAFTPRELEVLSAFANPTTPEPTSAGYGEIALRDAANLIPSAGNSIARSLLAVADPTVSKADIANTAPILQFVQPPTLDDTATTGQRVTHTILGGVAPEVAAALVPYLGVSKVAKVMGAGEVLSTVLGNVAQGGFSGAQFGGDEAGRMALTGGATSAVGALPWAARIPAALGIAGADYAYMRSNPNTSGMATTAAAVDALAGLVGYGKTEVQGLKEVKGRVVEPEVAPSGLKLATESPALPISAPAATGGIPAPEALTSAIRGMADDSGMKLGAGPIPQVQGPAVGSDLERIANLQNAPEMNLAFGEVLPPSSLRDTHPPTPELLVPPKIITPGETIPRPEFTIDNPIPSSGPLAIAPKAGDIRSPEFHAALNTDPTQVAEEAALRARKGKVQAVPEYMRTQGGGVQREILAPIIGAGIGGTAGYQEGGVPGAIAGVGAGALAGFGLSRALEAKNLLPHARERGTLGGSQFEKDKAALTKYIVDPFYENVKSKSDAELIQSLELQANLIKKRFEGKLGLNSEDTKLPFNRVPIAITYEEALRRNLKVPNSELLNRYIGHETTEVKSLQSFPKPEDTKGNVASLQKPEATWMDDALAERRAAGWDDKWPFVPADLHNKDFVQGIITDPTISRAEKERILKFTPIKVELPSASKPTETPEFKAWFGNSVVKDEAGNPAIQYHGTNTDTEYNIFNQASHFGSSRSADIRLGDTIKGDKARIFPAYLRIEKPIGLKDFNSNHGFLDYLAALKDGGAIDNEFYKKLYLEHTSAEEAWAQGTKGMSYLQSKKSVEWRALKATESELLDRAFTEAEKKGFDGFKYTNTVEDKGSTSYVPFRANQIKSATGNSGVFSRLNPDIRGTVSREVVLPLAGAGVGAAVGEKKNGTEGAIAGFIIGGTAGIIGSKLIDSIERVSPKLKAPEKGMVQTAKLQTEGAFKGVKEALNRPFKDLAGEDVTGRGGILSKTVRIMEDQFRLSMPDSLKTIITQARGFASEIVDSSQRALKTVMRLNPTEEVKNATNKFLNGELIDVPAEITWLRGNGALNKEEFGKLMRSEKEEYVKWTTRQPIDPTDAEKGMVSYYVKPGVKEKFLSLQEEQFLNGLPEEWKGYGEHIATSRRGMNSFQELLGDALPDGKLRNQILDSVGRYVPRMYRIFTDTKYRPSDEQISAAMQEFGFNKVSAEIATALETKKGMEAPQYLERIANLQKTSSPDDQIHLERLAKYQEVQHNGHTYNFAPDVAKSLTKYHNEDYLRKEVENYLQEINANRGAMKGGKGLDKTMFMERENITPAFRDMLGEYTDPVERMAIGMQKMYAPSQAARLISMARDLEVDGLPASMSDDVWAATNNKLRQDIQTAERAGDNSTIATLQDRLVKLNAYGKLPSDIKFGDFSGLYVNRFVKDYFNEDWRIWENSMGRHMASLNNLFKTAHIPLNPVTQLRQWVSMPFFAAIGKSTPASINQALGAYRNISPELRKELLQQGIWTADFIRGELKGSVDTILNGRYDTGLMKAGRKLYEGTLEAYRIPDMLIRGGTYISAKNRIAKELGKALDDPTVIQKAVEWTDRYTMNYDNISKFVRNVRNVPLVNPFVSFQAEILRILKNMAVDGATKNPERLATLGGILAFPAMMMAVGESGLSSDDKKLWAKTKSQLPDYLKYQALVPIAKLQNGNFKYLSLSSIIPQDNLEQSVRAMVKGDPNGFATVNPFFSSDKSPLFNAISELVTNTDKETGLTYRDNLERVSDIVGEFLPPLAPGGYEWSKLANVNVENLRSGKKQDWGDIALRYTTGLTAGIINPSTTERAGASQLKRDIANLRQYYLRVAQTTASDESKLREYNKYRQGVAHLVTDFATKYGQ